DPTARRATVCASFPVAGSWLARSIWRERVGDNLLHAILAELVDQAVALRVIPQFVDGLEELELRGVPQKRPRLAAQLERGDQRRRRRLVDRRLAHGAPTPFWRTSDDGAEKTARFCGHFVGSIARRSKSSSRSATTSTAFLAHDKFAGSDSWPPDFNERH